MSAFTARARQQEHPWAVTVRSAGAGYPVSVAWCSCGGHADPGRLRAGMRRRLALLCSIRAGERDPGHGRSRRQSGPWVDQTRSRRRLARAAGCFRPGSPPARGSGAGGAGPRGFRPAAHHLRGGGRGRRGGPLAEHKKALKAGTSVPPETMERISAPPSGTRRRLSGTPPTSSATAGQGRRPEPPELGRHTGRRIHRGHGNRGLRYTVDSVTTYTKSTLKDKPRLGIRPQPPGSDQLLHGG